MLSFSLVFVLHFLRIIVVVAYFLRIVVVVALVDYVTGSSDAKTMHRPTKHAYPHRVIPREKVSERAIKPCMLRQHKNHAIKI
jgi:hypothetical protein